MGTGGQTLEDMFKYVEDEVEAEGDDGASEKDRQGDESQRERKEDQRKGVSRLEMARQTLEWRHMAPTAPDTLCEHRSQYNPCPSSQAVVANSVSAFHLLPTQGATPSMKTTHSSCNTRLTYTLLATNLVLRLPSSTVRRLSQLNRSRLLSNPPAYAFSSSDTLDQPTRIILLPKFSQSGTLVLVHTETLEVRTIEFDIPAWKGDE